MMERVQMMEDEEKDPFEGLGWRIRNNTTSRPLSSFQSVAGMWSEWCKEILG